jgi:hypothetical protein
MNSIEQIEKFYSKNAGEIPTEIQLNSYTKITDTAAFIQSHLAYVNTYSDKPLSLPYKARLIELIKILTKK